MLLTYIAKTLTALCVILQVTVSKAMTHCVPHTLNKIIAACYDSSVRQVAIKLTVRPDSWEGKPIGTDGRTYKRPARELK